MLISNRQRKFEILSVLITALGKFIFFDLLHLQFWFIMAISLFWMVFVIIHYRKNPEIVNYWGFRKDGFWQSLKTVVPVALLVVMLFLIYGIYTEHLLLSWHIFPTLLLYPLWGIAQQYLMLALVAGNLADMKEAKIPVIVIILLTSVLFSGVHYPNYALMGGTFILAMIYIQIYLKYRNLWVLGLFHGWLGAFFYFFVLSKDPWAVFVNSI